MGCDIHLYKEKKVDGKWVTADDWAPCEYDPDSIELADDCGFYERNYDLFGVLCKGVRREHHFGFEPRGMPFDVSPEVKSEASDYGCDGHSHSYLYLHELHDLLSYLQDQTINVSGKKDGSELRKLEASIASGKPDWNFLYPYCQGSNVPEHEPFEVDVPADFMVGGGIRRIISGFDGIDGENHRIVFFFDN